MLIETSKALAKRSRGDFRGWLDDLYFAPDPLYYHFFNTLWDATYKAIQADKRLMVKGNMIA